MIDRTKFNCLSEDDKNFLADVTCLPEWNEDINGVVLGEDILVNNIEGYCSTENDDNNDINRFVNLLSKLII